MPGRGPMPGGRGLANGGRGGPMPGQVRLAAAHPATSSRQSNAVA